VIFDLDGTLLDTLEDLTDSVNDALAARGFPKRTRDEVRRFVGNGLRRTMSLSIPEGESNPGFGDCLHDFLNHYERNMRRKTAPYDGVLDLLRRLCEAGFKLAVVSNKRDAAVRELCGTFFSGYIIASFGEADDMPRKPAPDIVEKALRALGSTRDSAVYVGDSEVDAQTARNAGVVFIGATWGFRDRDTLEKAGAAFLIDAPEELCGIVGIQPRAEV
jgi:phosphoglycolate phosphatase